MRGNSLPFAGRSCPPGVHEKVVLSCPSCLFPSRFPKTEESGRRNRRAHFVRPLCPSRFVHFVSLFFIVREAVSMVFNVDRSPALQPPLCFFFVLLCKSALQALRVSAPPRELFPPALLALPWRTLRTLRETFFRPPSSLHPLRRGRMPHLRKWSGSF